MRRRLLVLAALVGIVALAAGVLRYEVLPRYRPGLRAGEQYGIDVSNHQGKIDWPRVAAADVSFAYIKASEGNDFRDQRFAANWAGAQQAGVAHGAYHFFTLCSSGADQAKNFLGALPDDPEALPPAVDLEFAGCTRRPDNATVQRELRTFVDTVESRVGKPVLIYAVAAFVKAYPLSPALRRDQWQRRLFRRPAPTGWTVWQASDRAHVKGIEGPVDLDVGRLPAGP